MSDILLEIKKVGKVYPNRKEALKDVSFQIYKKEIFALLGVNGAGKTTLSSVIASLIPPTYGDVLFDSHSIYKDIVKYRHIIGFCPQFQNLDFDLNVEENLVFAGRYYGLCKKEIKERKEFLLDQFNLNSYKKANLDTLSGGYKQRFMIARTVMHNPKLIILDEPTVGLDPRLRRELWKYILQLKDEGVTVILTTHYLDEADILSDRVCVIDDGEIKTIDTPSKLKNQCKKKNLEEVFLDLINEKSKVDEK